MRSDVGLSVFDVLIDSEVGDHVVNWVSLAWLDVVPLVSSDFLSLLETLVGLYDSTHSLVSTEVGHKVVHGVGVFWLNL